MRHVGRELLGRNVKRVCEMHPRFARARSSQHGWVGVGAGDEDRLRPGPPSRQIKGRLAEIFQEGRPERQRQRAATLVRARTRAVALLVEERVDDLPEGLAPFRVRRRILLDRVEQLHHHPSWADVGAQLGGALHHEP